MNGGVYTLSDLFRTDAIEHNKTRLANYLGVNRGTVIKYLKDKEGKDHEVRLYNHKYQLMIRKGK